MFLNIIQKEILKFQKDDRISWIFFAAYKMGCSLN